MKNFNKLFVVVETRKKPRMRKYHPYVVVFWLLIIGFVNLSLCIFGGIWIAHGIGLWFDKLGADPNFFSDFLGGALGLTVGFSLDKSCIERISHVSKYIKLMLVVKHELEEIKRGSYKNGCDGLLVTSYKWDKTNGKEQVVVKANEEIIFSEDELAKNDIENDESLKEKYKKMDDFNRPYKIYEYILDDLVKNAETMSILANLPLTSEYSIELINSLSLIQKCIEHYAKCIEEYEKEEPSVRAVSNEMRRKWLLLQYNINRVIEVL